MAFYSVQQFRTFRVIFGLYLAWHFAALLPAAKELFSREGMIPDPSLQPNWWLYQPLFLGSWDFEEPWAITAFLTTMVLTALAFTWGAPFRRLCALILWYGWAYLANRNLFIANPGLPYVGWLLLACAIIPPDDEPSATVQTFQKLHRLASRSTRNLLGVTLPGAEDPDSEDDNNSDSDSDSSNDPIDDEPPREGVEEVVTTFPAGETALFPPLVSKSLTTLSPSRPLKKGWYMPRVIYYSAWFLMAAGYTVSGLHKLQCPSWIDGTALTHVLTGLLSRHNALTRLLLTSPLLMKLLTWSSLALEIGFLPLGVFANTRRWYWLAMIAMHLGIISVINFTDLTMGVLMIHFFTFDHRWWRQQPLAALVTFWERYRRLSPVFFPMIVVLTAGLWVGFIITRYSPTWQIANLLFALMGFGLSAYSYYIETRQEENYVAMCDLKWASCTKVFKSEYGSLLGGQPNSFWGLCFYALVAALLAVGNSYQRDTVIQTVQYLSFGACLGSVYLAYLLIFKIKTVCIVCVSIYATNIMLFMGSRALLAPQ